MNVTAMPGVVCGPLGPVWPYLAVQFDIVAYSSDCDDPIREGLLRLGMHPVSNLYEQPTPHPAWNVRLPNHDGPDLGEVWVDSGPVIIDRLTTVFPEWIVAMRRLKHRRRHCPIYIPVGETAPWVGRYQPARGPGDPFLAELDQLAKAGRLLGVGALVTDRVPVHGY